MFPPFGSYSLDVEAISGVCGSISIACWVVVFSPQIIENFKRSSAEGLSVEFVVIWLLGDVFNILGAVLQGVLTTMIVLAVYYTIADVVLLGQCFYYRGFSLRDARPGKHTNVEGGQPTERSRLLVPENGDASRNHASAADIEPNARNRSSSSFRERLASMDGTHLSPAAPMHPQPKNAPATEVLIPSQPRSWGQAIFFNSTAIVLVVLAGVAGYYLSPSASDQGQTSNPAKDQAESLIFNVWGQVFGYICAVLYLGSRIPQLLLNYRRKSTEGLNALFFLFACIGNLTYVCSILAFQPRCVRHDDGDWREANCRSGEAGTVYGRYILVNFSWLLGSFGTLFLDLAVFAQFWLYRSKISSNDDALDVDPEVIHGDGRGRSSAER